MNTNGYAARWAPHLRRLFAGLRTDNPTRAFLTDQHHKKVYFIFSEPNSGEQSPNPKSLNFRPLRVAQSAAFLNAVLSCVPSPNRQKLNANCIQYSNMN